MIAICECKVNDIVAGQVIITGAEERLRARERAYFSICSQQLHPTIRATVDLLERDRAEVALEPLDGPLRADGAKITLARGAACLQQAADWMWISSHEESPQPTADRYLLLRLRLPPTHFEWGAIGSRQRHGCKQAARSEAVIGAASWTRSLWDKVAVTPMRTAR